MIERETLESSLAKLGRPRVLIVGDVMLDRYVSGDVTRISPEAPIPVLAAKRSDQRLGGSGNVAANLAAMGAQCELVAVVGQDESGDILRELLGEARIGHGGIVVDDSRPTIRKTRFVSGVQQMMRVDWEDARALEAESRAQVLALALERLSNAQAVVLSDYGKGLLSKETLTTLIGRARAARIPVLVDPKGTDYARYKGATLLTPNRKEAEQALGRRLPDMPAVEAGARDLIAIADLEVAIVTLGSEGIFWCTKDGACGHDPAQARQVFDVTGAGDTVVAHLALYLASGFELPIAVALANHAAGIVVGRLGTNAVTRAELRARLRETRPHEGKVVLRADLHDLIAAWRAEKKRIVFTNGCFDILHVGHVDYLRFARSRGDVLLVGVNEDESVRRQKGPERPVNPLRDRMEMLAALEMVDAVTHFGEDTPKEIIEQVTPDVLVKGADWTGNVVGQEWVEQHGGQVHLAKLVPGRSTSSILERACGLRKEAAPPGAGSASSQKE